MLADVVDQSLLCDQPSNVLLHDVAEQSLFIMTLATFDDSVRLLLLMLVHPVLALQVVHLFTASGGCSRRP
eukprot:14744119-Heterocapsa_arctica.AAC.1